MLGLELISHSLLPFFFFSSLTVHAEEAVEVGGG